MRDLIASMAALSVTTTACFALAGCAADGQTGDVQVGASITGAHATIFGGERDQAATLSGVVAIKVDNGATFELCTGALVAPNVVLTARHCVSKNKSRTVVCDANGRSTNGDHVFGDVEARTIQIYTGADPQFSKEPVARGKQIIRGEGNVLCDGDIALVVLDGALEGVQVLPVRVGQAIHPGETIKTIGYGRNDQKLPIGTRMMKTGVDVLAVGRGTSASKTALGAHEFETGMATCEGDSGGPAISEKTGAVIGVVSRGGDCDEDFGHIYTSTVMQQDLFQRAFDATHTVPELEAGSSLDPKHAALGADGDTSDPPAKASGCAQSGVGASRGGPMAAAALGVLALVGALRRRKARASS